MSTGDNARVQDLGRFRLPEGFRGRSPFVVQLWWLVQALLFRPSPQIFYGWRRWLMRAFGANIGDGVLLRPTVVTTYPWKVTIGRNAWVGDNATLYSLGPIVIGDNAVVSQEAYLCTGTHDYGDSAFRIYAEQITIEAEAWVAARAFISPGITVGAGAVVAACSTVTKNVDPMSIVAGTPARKIGERVSFAPADAR